MSRVLVDSGIGYLGNIPSEWNIFRIKNAFKCKKNIVNDNWSNTQLLSLTTSGVKEKDIDNPNGKLPDSFNGYQYVEINNIIMCLFDLDCSAVFSGISKYNGMISPAYKVLECKEMMNPDYAGYYFNYISFDRKYMHYSKNIRYTLNYDEFSSLPMLIPPLEEQRKIAEYLDKQCAKIDEIIRDNNKEIELLNEYKLSEIEKSIFKGLNENEQYIECRKKWVGKMNSKYELIPIKYLKSKKKNAFVDGPFGSNLKSEHFIDNGDVYVIESGFISTGKFIFKDFKTISNEHFETIKRSECNEKDIIIAKIGASYGMCAELPYLDKKSVVSGNSLKITLDNNKILNEIFIKEMQIAKNKGGFLELVNETAQPALSLSGLNNFKLVVPPMEEQVIIVKEINRIETKIDEVIKYRRNIINSLEEYKRSLIYECVTGKRKV